MYFDAAADILPLSRPPTICTLMIVCIVHPGGIAALANTPPVRGSLFGGRDCINQTQITSTLLSVLLLSLP